MINFWTALKSIDLSNPQNSALLLAAACAFAYGFFKDDEAARALLSASVHINVLLFVFNFIPIPPLDGSKVVWGLIPDRHMHRLRFFEEQTWIAPTAFLAVFFFAGPIIGRPMHAISDLLFSWFA